MNKFVLILLIIGIFLFISGLIFYFIEKNNKNSSSIYINLSIVIIIIGSILILIGIIILIGISILFFKKKKKKEVIKKKKKELIDRKSIQPDDSVNKKWRDARLIANKAIENEINNNNSEYLDMLSRIEKVNFEQAKENDPNLTIQKFREEQNKLNEMDKEIKNKIENQKTIFDPIKSNRKLISKKESELNSDKKLLEIKKSSGKNLFEVENLNGNNYNEFKQNEINEIVNRIEEREKEINDLKEKMGENF